MHVTQRSHWLHLAVLGAVQIAAGLVSLLSFGSLAVEWNLRAQRWYMDADFKDTKQDRQAQQEAEDRRRARRCERADARKARGR